MRTYCGTTGGLIRREFRGGVVDRGVGPQTGGARSTYPLPPHSRVLHETQRTAASAFNTALSVIYCPLLLSLSFSSTSALTPHLSNSHHRPPYNPPSPPHLSFFVAHVTQRHHYDSHAPYSYHKTLTMPCSGDDNGNNAGCECALTQAGGVPAWLTAGTCAPVQVADLVFCSYCLQAIE